MKDTKYSEILISETEKEMEEKLEKVTQNNPTDILAYLKLGDIERDKKNGKMAARLHRSLLANPSIDIQLKRRIYRSIIRDYLSIPDYENAISFSRELEKIAKRDIESLELIYETYEDRELFEDAIRVKERIFKIRGEVDKKIYAILHAFIGRNLIKAGKEREGLKYLKQSLSIDELCIPSILFMGDYYWEKKQTEKSIEFFKRIIKEAPAYSGVAFEKLEKIYYEEGKFSEMVKIYEEFLDKNPDDTRALFNLALLYRKRGDIDEAIVLLKRAKETNPKDINVIREIFEILYENKHFDELARVTMEFFNIIDSAKKFRCENCKEGFNEFMSKCPNCKKWLTIK